MKFLSQLKADCIQYLTKQSTLEFTALLLLVYLALDAIILAWFLLTPLLVQSGSRLLFGLGMLGYNYGYLATNCHQMPQRSILLGGFQFPFCSRDTGVYVGCLIGAAVPLLNLKLPKFMKSLLFCALLLTPLVVDGVTQTLLHMRESDNTLRLLTGLLFGFGFAYFFAARIAEHSKGVVDYGAEGVRAARISAVIITLLLAAAYIVGDDYKTMGAAVAESGLKPTFVTYVPGRAVDTVGFDPYIHSYEDAVLDRLRQHGYQGHGLWVIYEGSVAREGRHVYFTKGDGTFALISDVNST